MLPRRSFSFSIVEIIALDYTCKDLKLGNWSGTKNSTGLMLAFCCWHDLYQAMPLCNAAMWCSLPQSPSSSQRRANGQGRTVTDNEDTHTLCFAACAPLSAGTCHRLTPDQTSSPATLPPPGTPTSLGHQTASSLFGCSPPTDIWISPRGLRSSRRGRTRC